MEAGDAIGGAAAAAAGADGADSFCVCRPLREGPMLECTAGTGGCNGWVHPNCFNMTEAETIAAEADPSFVCALCAVDARRGRGSAARGAASAGAATYVDADARGGGEGTSAESGSDAGGGGAAGAGAPEGEAPRVIFDDASDEEVRAGGRKSGGGGARAPRGSRGHKTAQTQARVEAFRQNARRAKKS